LCTYAKEVIKSANNSSELIRRLLLFARKSEMRFIETNVHGNIDQVVSVLSRSIDKKISIQKKFRAISPEVSTDPAQFQNGLLNIAINARDAMSDGGEFGITTDNVVIDEKDFRARQHDPVSGPCVECSISDIAEGILAENLERIFEPFFTTKETGKGMGLAIVYGM
jgi:two-component system cell cycle sensor histidine kinase/response regulator CckA